MNVKKLVPVVLAAALVAGCATGSGPKQTGDTLLSAVLGALAGSQIGSGKGQLAAVTIGALAGVYLGGEVGKSLDAADRQAIQSNAQNSLEDGRTGQTSSWRNPDSGHSGTFTPTRTYVNTAGSDCRDYESTIYVDGREETVVGQACRQPEGTWRISQ